MTFRNSLPASVTRVSMVACLVAAALTARPLSAAQFIVADGDVPGLIAAIHAANANGEADEIVLAEDGLYLLTGVDNATAGENGLPSISSEITFTGNDASIERSGDPNTPAFRLFHIAADGMLTLNDTKLFGGLADGIGVAGSGGGIQVEDGSLAIHGGTVNRHTAAEMGGGIYVLNGTAILATNLYSNSAESGGGIAVSAGSDVSVIVGNVSSNRAFRGGAVYNQGSFSITGAMISNVADGALAPGGALFNATGGQATIGAIVGQNTAGGDGGGVYVAPGSAVNLFDARLRNNLSGAVYGAGRGGGVFNNGGSVTIRDSILFVNIARGGYGRGGGVAVEAGGTVDIMNSAIDRNRADNVGGGLHVDGGSVTVTLSSISDGVSLIFGGGIYVEAGTVVVQDSVLAGNFADLSGGAAYNRDTLEFQQTRIEDNFAVGSGGGVHNSNFADLVLTDCFVHSNEALSGGGGIQSAGNSTTTLVRSIISENTTPYAGGGVYNQGILTMLDTTIQANMAGGGGGILSWGTLTATSCTISANESSASGGVLNVSGHADLTNCTISGNRGIADDDGDPGDRSGGGGVVLSGGTVSLRNCTVSFNEGWGLRAGRGSVITNTIISNNLLGDCGSYDDIDFGYNVFGDGGCVTTATSISGDPSLGPLADNGGPALTHALLPGSIAINAGDCSGGTVTTDQRGVGRPRGGACDIGAFEFGPPPPRAEQRGRLSP